MDDLELARLEHENMIETIAITGSQVPGGRVERHDGVVLILTGLPVLLFNQVIVEEDATRPEAIAAAVGQARAAGVPFVVNLRDQIDDGHRPLMAALGLEAMPGGPWLPGMACHPLVARGSVPVPDGHEIRRVVDAAGVAGHVTAASEGFGMPREWLELVMNERMANEPGRAVYVGFTDGVPLTAGLGVRTGRTIGVYNIATVQSARRRGYGAAMTMRIVDDGAAEGCDTAILQASDMGYSTYERLGFRTVVTYTGYVEPSPLAREHAGHAG